MNTHHALWEMIAVAAIFVIKDRNKVEVCNTLIMVVTTEGVPFAKMVNVVILVQIVPRTVTRDHINDTSFPRRYEHSRVVRANSITGTNKIFPYSALHRTQDLQTTMASPNMYYEQSVRLM